MIHLLLTSELRSTMPKSIRIIFEYKDVEVYFPTEHLWLKGDNVILDGKVNDFINWLKPFNNIPVGNGVPQLEEFELLDMVDLKFERKEKLKKIDKGRDCL